MEALFCSCGVSFTVDRAVDSRANQQGWPMDERGKEKTTNADTGQEFFFLCNVINDAKIARAGNLMSKAFEQRSGRTSKQGCVGRGAAGAL